MFAGLIKFFQDVHYIYIVHSLTTSCWLSLRFDLRTVPVDFAECLMRFMPTEAEVKTLRQYERERRPLSDLTDEDRFMMMFSKIERLPQRMTIMAFMGNFSDSLQMLTPVRSIRVMERRDRGWSEDREEKGWRVGQRMR